MQYADVIHRIVVAPKRVYVKVFSFASVSTRDGRKAIWFWCVCILSNIAGSSRHRSKRGLCTTFLGLTTKDTLHTYHHSLQTSVAAHVPPLRQFLIWWMCLMRLLHFSRWWSQSNHMHRLTNCLLTVDPF